MSLHNVSSIFESSKTNEICWSKTAFIATFVVGVEEYYFSGIFRIIQKITNRSGKEHQCSRKDRLDFSWIFDDSGLYAAAVNKSGWFLYIIIYDCLEKKSYNYLNKLTDIEADHFYWFNGDLILIHINQNGCIQQIQIEVDHFNRRAEVIKTRTYDFPYITNEYGHRRSPYLKKLRSRTLTESIETAVLNNEEYILLLSSSCSTAIMIPKDPNSINQMRQSMYFHPENNIVRVTGARFQALQPICHQQFLYFPKICETSYIRNKHMYILDEFIEVDLLKLRDTQGQGVNIRYLREQRNYLGKEVPFCHVGSVPENISQPKRLVTAKSFANGQTLTIVEENDTKIRHSCLIDVKLKQITWRIWQPKIQWKANMILSSLHPSGYFIEIDYKKKQEDDKYKLYSKIVAHPNETIKLKIMSFVNLLTNESPIHPTFVNMLRRFL